MFIPEPNKQYKITYLVLENFKWVEQFLLLTIKDYGTFYNCETYNNCTCYECYDNNGYRYLFYLDKIHNTFCYLKRDKSHIEIYKHVKFNDNNNDCWYRNIYNIYLDDILVFTNTSNHYMPFEYESDSELLDLIDGYWS
jgi:hypothetical protein